MSAAYPVAAYAKRLPQGKRDVFALFAHYATADAMHRFLRDVEGRAGDLPACPVWFWLRPKLD